MTASVFPFDMLRSQVLTGNVFPVGVLQSQVVIGNMFSAGVSRSDVISEIVCYLNLKSLNFINMDVGSGRSNA